MDAYAEKRYNDSIPHLTKAAHAGHLNAMAQLGAMFLKGEGVARDAKQSAQWFKQCADKGHAQCQSLLGLLYLNGVGVPKNAMSARLWLQKAADQGDERSAWVLENLIERGALKM